MNDIDKIDMWLNSLSIVDKPNNDNIFEHIFYEFFMFQNTAIYTTGLFYGWCEPNANVKNAILESYRIHLRCVADFFTKRPFKETDITRDNIYVNDILNDSVYEKCRFIPLSQKARDGINKSTGHLSQTRIKMSVEIQRDIFGNGDFKQQAKNIQTFLRCISVANINEMYFDQLKNEAIQQKLSNLKTLYGEKDS